MVEVARLLDLLLAWPVGGRGAESELRVAEDLLVGLEVAAGARDGVNTVLDGDGVRSIAAWIDIDNERN